MNRNDKNKETQGKEYAKNKNDFFYYHDQTYLELVEDVLENGVFKGDRTGTGTYSVFGRQMHFQLDNGTIPLLTSKKMHTRSIIYEILWYLQGGTNIQYLQDNGVRIWNEWADENGDLGPIYGYQWRNWPKAVDAKVEYNTDPPHCEIQHEHIDQVAEVIHKLKNNPTDRRIIISAWNVGQLEEMALPPCHAFFQFWVNVYNFDRRWKEMEKVLGKEEADYQREQMSMGMLLDTMEAHGIPRGELSCQLYQRSCDVGLGVPFNIVQYSILTHMFAHVTNLKAKEFIWTGGDVHIYTNHIDALKEQLTRKPYISPKLKLNPDVKDIDGFSFEDFEITDYYSHPTIKMEVSV